MKDNPPAAADAPSSRSFAKIGLVPGQDFDASKLEARTSPSACPRSASTASCCSSRSARRRPGHQRLGLHDQDRPLRHRLPAAGARHRDRPRRQPAAGRGLPDLAEGRRTAAPTTAPNKYVMRFPKGQLPPVQGFWSLTMYDAQLLLRRQPDQPLLDQRAPEPEGQPGRLDRSLHPERVARAPTRNRTGCRRRPASSS